MTAESTVRPGALAAQDYVPPLGRRYSAPTDDGREPANLGDILERVLDKGLVIAGDIRVNLLDIELLTIKLRLLVASVNTARELGIDWWENDPWLTSGAMSQRRRADQRRLAEENSQLRARLSAIEAARGTRPAASQAPFAPLRENDG